jgi:hypothetical protein
MPVIANKNWSVLRSVAIGGGFTPDPDWLVTNNTAAARAAGTFLAPQISLRTTVQYTLLFLDAAGNALLGAAAAVASMARIAIVSSAGRQEALVFDQTVSVSGAVLVGLPTGNRMEMVFRITDITDPPPTAQTMQILGLLV